MAVSVTSLSGPTAPVAPGAKFQLTVGFTNPDRTTVYTATDEQGGQAKISITTHENVIISTDPTLVVGGKAPAGVIVVTSSDPADVLTPDATLPNTVDVTSGLT